MPRVPLVAFLLGFLALGGCGSASGERLAATPPTPGGLVLEPDRLEWVAVDGGPAPPARSVRVGRTDGGALAWSAGTSAPWIVLRDASGAAGDAFAVGVDLAALGPGTHAATIRVTETGGERASIDLPVSLRVDAAPASPCGCPPLPAPPPDAVAVSTASALEDAILQANATGGNVTILLADGTYALSRPLYVTAPDVTVRGASGDRDGVVLRGAGMTGSVTHVFLVAAPRFAVADVTLGWVRHHGIQIQGEQDADDALIHGVRFVDTGEQMLKVSFDASRDESGDRGRVRCCEFVYTAGVGPQYYIGGIDVHRGRDWRVERCRFRGIRSPEALLAEHAIHFWSDAAGTVVEANTIVDCDRGIGFGLGASGHGSGVIRNNFVRTTRDVGIGLESAVDVLVLHNTVHAGDYPNAIEVRFGGTRVAVANNLTVGGIRERDGGVVDASGNVEVTDPGLVFVDPDAGDLHLRAPTAGIVDAAPPRDDAPCDIDGEPRPAGGAADVGADERGA